MEIDKLAVEIVEFKEIDRSSLKGFVTVRIPALRMRIVDCTVNESNGRRWIGLPGKPQLGRDQEVIRKDGKVQYTPTCVFEAKAVGDAFSMAVLKKLDRFRAGRD